jgi:hypothetical protein
MSDEMVRAEKADWLAQRPANDLRNDLRVEIVNAQSVLDLACERSVDPAVRGAYERVRSTKEMLRRLSE